MSLAQRGNEARLPSSDRLARPWVRFAILTVYYLGILLGLVVLYGQGNFSTPPFIYQNF
jgi:hypothetical protein